MIDQAHRYLIVTQLEWKTKKRNVKEKWSQINEVFHSHCSKCYVVIHHKGVIIQIASFKMPKKTEAISEQIKSTKRKKKLKFSLTVTMSKCTWNCINIAIFSIFWFESFLIFNFLQFEMVFWFSSHIFFVFIQKVHIIAYESEVSHLIFY